MGNEKHYDTRIEAVNYALEHDDGMTAKNYPSADLILIGVSRSGKTPTCLYLAMQYGIKVANYPLAPEDLDRLALPNVLKCYKHKLFGLTIDPLRLHQIRQERRAHSSYSALRNCRFELKRAESLYQHAQIPSLNTTHQSIEELAANIMQISKIKRRC